MVHLGRGPGPAAHRPGSTDQLISRTRLRLALVTMGLLTALIVGVGATTAVLALRALDDSVDRALDSAATAAVQRLGDTDSSGSPAGGSGASAGSGGTEAEASNQPGSSAAADSGADADGDRGQDVDHEPQAADTFFLYLDTHGAALADPGNVTLVGLPDATAVAAAAQTGRDLRTVAAGSVPVRLLTIRLSDDAQHASGVSYVQTGFVLRLRDEQADTLLRTIFLVGLIGLVAAAALTYIITGRALVPIRSTFARERRFVATSSHELRTPIALIRSTAEVLDREGLVAPDGRPLVADIVAETDRLGRLVSDLSALATAQAGPVPVAVPLDLAALIAETVRRTAPMATERGVTLQAPTTGAPIRVLGVADQLVQVTLILIDNAIKATSDGGTVRVAVGQRGRFGELMVDDEGGGIPEVDRERIFEPLARLNAGRYEDTGSGLGLAIARAMVDRLGGSIVVGQAPSRGARFIVSMPLA
jgi:signal transduction histidine kinase